MLWMQCAAVKELYGSLRTEHEAQEDATKAAAPALASLQEENKALKREVERLQGVNARQARESACQTAAACIMCKPGLSRHGPVLCCNELWAPLPVLWGLARYSTV